MLPMIAARHWPIALGVALVAGIALQTWRVHSLRTERARLLEALATEEARGDAIERMAEEQANAVTEWRERAEASQRRAARAAAQAAKQASEERLRVDALGVTAEQMQEWWDRAAVAQ